MFKVGSTTTTAQTPGIPPDMNEQDADLKNIEGGDISHNTML